MHPSFLVLLVATAAWAQSPPAIGTEFVTGFTMSADGQTQSGTLYASNDQSLFYQTHPVTEFPYQLNLCSNGFDESYMAYNNKTCFVKDDLFCTHGQDCLQHDCTCLFDNPFLGLKDTDFQGTCKSGPGAGAQEWSVSNGGYTLTYCIIGQTFKHPAQPVSLLISGAGGNINMTFTDFEEQSVPSSTFDIPSTCACSQ